MLSTVEPARRREARCCLGGADHTIARSYSSDIGKTRVVSRARQSWAAVALFFTLLISPSYFRFNPHPSSRDR